MILLIAVQVACMVVLYRLGYCHGRDTERDRAWWEQHDAWMAENVLDE